MSRFILNFESLKDMVYEYLQNQRATSRLKPGEKIRENEICAALNISRTPVREALIKLEAEGFLTILPRRGFIVKKITLKEIEDVYKTIGCLEGYAARLASGIMKDSEFAALSDLDKKMQDALTRARFSDFSRYNLFFHDVYLKSINNETISGTVALLKKKIYDYSINMKVIPSWYEKAAYEHAEIIALFKKGDSKELENYIREVHWNFEENLKYIKEELSF